MKKALLIGVPVVAFVALALSCIEIRIECDCDCNCEDDEYDEYYD